MTHTLPKNMGEELTKSLANVAARINARRPMSKQNVEEYAEKLEKIAATLRENHTKVLGSFVSCLIIEGSVEVPEGTELSIDATGQGVGTTPGVLAAVLHAMDSITEDKAEVDTALFVAGVERTFQRQATSRSPSEPSSYKQS